MKIINMKERLLGTILTEARHVTMTFEELKNLLDNPIQRDTPEHAEKAKKTHLKKWLPVHGLTFAASQLPDGTIHLSDGHTRVYLIEDGHFNKADLPKHFTVLVIPAKDLDEVESHYGWYDSDNAKEDVGDKNFSAFKGIGYEPRSTRFRKGNDLSCIPSLLCEGVRAKDRKTWLNMWIKELIMLDSFDIPVGAAKGVGKTVTAPFIAAMCQCLAAECDPSDVKDFIMKVRNDDGIQRGNTRDGVSSFVRWYTTTEKAKSGGAGYPVTQEYALRCFLMYQKGTIESAIPNYKRERAKFDIVRENPNLENIKKSQKELPLT
jgi:hypothetical protein